MKNKIPFITNIIERRSRKRLRCVMRGYQFLKESNRLSLITEVKESLTNTHLSRLNVNSSTHIFGAGIQYAEVIIRQYLLVRVAGLNLNKSLLYALGKPRSAVIYPLPLEWRKIIEQHGFKVSKIWSFLAWNGFVMMMLAYGMISIVIQILKNIKAVFQSPCHPFGRYAYFETLSAGNLPQPYADGRSHDIVTWYQQWTGRNIELDTICHNVKGIPQCMVKGIPVISIPSPIFPLSRLNTLIRFIGWSITASLIAVNDLFRGRWWHALLLNQAGKSAQVRLQDSEKIALDYLFHNSGWIYRPLWTYEAEKHGSRILFYFYSTNCESFKRPNGYTIQASSYQAMNWPNYLVWDEYQSNFVRRAVGYSANVNIVGPIWFHTSSKELAAFPSRTVAVFDVQPVRDSFYQTLGASFEYYTPSTANQFLTDIFSALIKLNASLALKRKRNISRLAHPEYRKFIGTFEQFSNFITVEPETSAIRVIEQSIAVISMPFTSTALLGRELGKPSIYYDPFGLVQKDDRAAHGIEILVGSYELNKWLENIMGENFDQ